MIKKHFYFYRNVGAFLFFLCALNLNAQFNFKKPDPLKDFSKSMKTIFTIDNVRIIPERPKISNTKTDEANIINSVNSKLIKTFDFESAKKNIDFTGISQINVTPVKFKKPLFKTVLVRDGDPMSMKDLYLTKTQQGRSLSGFSSSIYLLPLYNSEDQIKIYYILWFNDGRQYLIDPMDLIKPREVRKQYLDLLLKYRINKDSFNKFYGKDFEFKLTDEEIKTYNNNIMTGIQSCLDTAKMEFKIHYLFKEESIKYHDAQYCSRLSYCKEHPEEGAFQTITVVKDALKNKVFNKFSNDSNSIVIGKSIKIDATDITYRHSEGVGVDSIWKIQYFHDRKRISRDSFYNFLQYRLTQERGYPVVKINNYEKKLLVTTKWIGSVKLDSTGFQYRLMLISGENDEPGRNDYWFSNNLDSIYNGYYIKFRESEDVVNYYKKLEKREAAEKREKEETAKAMKEAERKYGKKYVDAALEGRIIVGMHEDLVSLQINRFWYLSSKTVGSTSAYYLKSMNGYDNSVLIYTKNKKVIRVTNW